MIELIREFLENQERKQGKGYPEQVLGTNSAVNKFGAFWESNHRNMDIIFAALLYEFTRDRTFTAEQLVAYKEGLASYEMFFQKCAEDKVKREVEATKELPNT